MKNISRVVSLVLFCLLSGTASSASAFEDVRYDITASLSAEDKTITAHETLSFKNSSGQELKEIYLRVYPNHKYSKTEIERLYKYASYFKVDPYPEGFDPGVFEVRRIAAQGRAAEYTFELEDQTVMKVVLPEPLKDGEVLSLEIEFFLKVPHHIGRYGWHQRTFALNRWYPLLGFLDKDGWHNDPDYLLHMPYVSDAAMYRVAFSLPEGYALVSGCDVSDEKQEGGVKVVTLSSSAPLRELSLAASPDYLLKEGEHDGVKIRSYYFARDAAFAERALESAQGILESYGRQFGPYPYKQFSIAPVYLGYGGSQNAGVIFLDVRAYRMPPFLNRYFDFLVAHETGHQWWYNVVGNDEYRQLWLDEGLNSYFITRYLEDKYGKDGRLIEMPHWVEYFIPNPSLSSIRTYRYRYFCKKGFDQPILSEMSSFYEPSMIFTIAYGKGSAVVDMLASLLGEEKFRQVMKTYFQRFAFKNATVVDFEKIVSEVAGKDLSWFFKEWLYETKACDYAIVREKGCLILKRLGQAQMPVDITLEHEGGKEEVVRSEGKARSEEIVLLEAKTLKKATADKLGKVLDVDCSNNLWPRRVDVRFVPLYHALYDVPLFQREDAYSWTTGPSFSSYGMGIKTSFQKPMDYIIYAATHYDTGAGTLNSSAGFEKHFKNKYLSWGFEFLDRRAYSDDEENLKTYKLYLRQELDLPYSLLDVSSHLTLYLLHNRSLGKGGFVGSREEVRNLNYRQNKETIFGATFYQANGGPFPDPSHGYKISVTQEVAGHVLGGGDDFSRTQVEWDKYVELPKGQKLAFRLKGGAGHPKDKYLFYLGSDRELRGYGYKEIKGSAAVLGSAEYRFPLVRDMDVRLFWQSLNLDQMQGVFFFDAGSAWFNSIFEPGFKKDVGFGLRFFFDVAGGAERVGLRIDAAWPLDSSDHDAHVWVGINQAF